MIDLHNHLLPGIDDGAPDLETALALTEIAVADGITHMVCTPHIHPGRYDNTPVTIAAAKALLVDALAAAAIDLKIATAAEVRFDAQLMLGVQEGDIPFLGEWQGRKVLLLEFPHSGIPYGADQMVHWLLRHDVVPMIAHPERNKGFLQQPARLRPFVAQGCLLQVTAGAVAGQFGMPAAALARDLLMQNLVTILASDAHNLQHRPPCMSEGLQAAAALIGQERAYALVMDRPWQIAQGHFQ